jgi:hypothetical protein
MVRSHNNAYQNTSRTSPTKAFSEQTILDLNEQLLTNGFHYLTVRNVSAGRTLFYTFLNSLNYYSEIACLTLSDQPLTGKVIDLYESLQQYGYLLELPYLEDLLQEKWQFDFLWIEVTQELLNTGWFYNFLDSLIEVHLQKAIPIFIVTFNDHANTDYI